MFASQIIGGNDELTVDRVFNAELCPAARFRSNHILRIKITARRHPRFLVKSFAGVDVRISADIISAIANRNKNIRSRDKGDIFFLVLIKTPFNCWNKCRRITSRLNISINIQTNFDRSADSDNQG